MRVNIEDLNTDQTVTQAVSETSANGKGRAKDTTDMSFNSIHFDHVYTSFDREPGSKTVRDPESFSSSTVLADFRHKDKMLVPDWKSSCAYYRNFKTSSNTSCAEFSGYNSRGRPKNSDPEISALNAETIQQVFQDMINMTSLTPVSDVDCVVGGTADHKKSDRLLEKREVKVVDALPYLTTKNAKSKSSSNYKIAAKREDPCKDKGADKTKAKNKHELQKGKEVSYVTTSYVGHRSLGSLFRYFLFFFTLHFLAGKYFLEIANGRLYIFNNIYNFRYRCFREIRTKVSARFMHSQNSKFSKTSEIMA